MLNETNPSKSDPSGARDDLEAVKGELDWITEKAKNGATSDELRHLIAKIHNREKYNFRGPIIGPGEIIYRARKMGSVPKHISEISYPPPMITKRGRLNREGRPIFYGSYGNVAPCIPECGAKDGDHFTIGEWTPKKPLLFYLLGVDEKILETRPNRYFPSLFLKKERHSLLDILKAWQCDVMTRPLVDGEDWIYCLSTALAEVAVQPMFEHMQQNLGEQMPAGIVYPSVATNTFGDNIAVRSEMIDRQFRFLKVVHVAVRNVKDSSKINSHNEPAYEINERQLGIADGSGTLAWTPPPTSGRRIIIKGYAKL